jgi:hypothetical protein
MVDDDDRERGFLRDELGAGVLRAEDEGGALIVGADGALRKAGEAEGDVVDAGEAGLVDELLVLEGVHDEGEELRDGFCQFGEVAAYIRSSRTTWGCHETRRITGRAWIIEEWRRL